MSYFTQIHGNVAHDSADSGNPVKVGGQAVNADRAAVANGDRVDFVGDLAGKQIVLPYANPENFVSGTGSKTDTSELSVIAAPGAGVRLYITSIIVSNTSATNARVTIKDGASGTTLLEVPAPANSGAIVPLPVPLRLTANKALVAVASASVTTMYTSAVGYKGV